MDILTLINQNINANGNQAITGSSLQYVLQQLVAYIDGKTGMTEYNVSAAMQLPLAAKDLVVAIAINPTQPIPNFSIGITNNGSEITTYQNIPANEWTVIQINYLAAANMILYISGILGNSVVRVYKN